MRKIIISLLRVEENLTVKDAFFEITSQTCHILNCERATVFVVDNEKHEIWTRAGTGIKSKSIRLPMDYGLVGDCVTHNRIVNVIDAHDDARFNKEMDEKFHFKT